MYLRDQVVTGPELLEEYIAQVTPRIVRNIYSGYSGEPHIITPGDKLNMLMDYRDVIDHDANTLRQVLGPIQAPWYRVYL